MGSEIKEDKESEKRCEEKRKVIPVKNDASDAQLILINQLRHADGLVSSRDRRETKNPVRRVIVLVVVCCWSGEGGGPAVSAPAASEVKKCRVPKHCQQRSSLVALLGFQNCGIIGKGGVD